jgi:hypothetical protein
VPKRLAPARFGGGLERNGVVGATHAVAGPISEKKGEQIACSYKVKERTIANAGTKWKSRLIANQENLGASLETGVYFESSRAAAAGVLAPLPSTNIVRDHRDQLREARMKGNEHVAFCLAIAAFAILLTPPAAHAQRCTGNINTGCTNPGAVCSPVSSGVGATGHCQTPAGLPKGEKECDCIGAPQLELTGTWTANDGGVYYLRQVGNELWWAGFSTESPAGANDLHKGLAFSNVLHGQITGNNTVTADWADVPRGRTLNSGTLTLNASNTSLQRQAVTGGFGATTWTRTSPAAAPTDIFTIFDEVKKNQNEWRDHSLLDNLKPAKDKPVAIFGSIVSDGSDPAPMHVNYPANKGRSYNDFICLDNNDSPPDGDIDFNIQVDRPELDKQINFWSNTGWETSHGVNPTNFRNKLDLHNTLHIESIMFGGTTECGDDGTTSLLLPGWQQAGAAAVLMNDVPIAGQMDLTDRGTGISSLNAILGRPMQFGARVRVTGNLVLDCGHGFLHNCDEDVASTQNQEIHPVYALDFLQNFQLPRQLALLTGVWSSDDSGTYYLRQVGNTVWWLGLSVDEGRTFANVFRGTLQNNQVSGNWADLPLGQTSNSGTITVTAASGPLSTGLTRSAVSGGFAGDSWQKLFDVGGRTIIVVFDSATMNGAWPSTPEQFELTVGDQRVDAQPTNPHAVTLPDGKQGSQVNLGTRITINAPPVGPLRMAASFAGYRANWAISESNVKPAALVQPLTAPRTLPANAAQANKSEVTDRDAKPPQTVPVGSGTSGLPALTVQYHIEQANASP